ncbi:hypothetical protein D3C87_1502900 [compost metagenome]
MHRKDVAVIKAVVAGLDHHAFHALAMRVGTEGKQCVAPAEAALGVTEVADGRIDHDKLLADVDLRPAFRPATGEQQPQRVFVRLRLPDDPIEVEAAAVEQPFEFRYDFFARLHLFDQREELHKQRDIHGSPSR